MNPERWKRVEEVFESALEHAPEERSAYLAQVCAGDESLRRQVETLIVSYKRAENFIEVPALAASSTSDTLIDDSPTSFIGRRVGSYKIVREIGRGGMGSVYLAVRADDEYQKRVAVKLIKRGMDTDFIIRRFRNERQILASLDHTYIARLLDGGTTEDGLPFFVMEYVEGQPIHHYCDMQKLSVAERLQLFRKVCAAVHYAHQNLIIHRDLKPGNILVAGDGTPKLLDFGIAKILNPEISSQMLDPTTAALRMMTPEYASPEQVRGESATAASDVYTLGVMLYELLTDHRPYQLRNRLPLEVSRIICEEEPERPSIAVNLIEVIPIDNAPPLEITPSSVSRARSSTPEQLRRQLSGNLDNIILKALRKEPQRRYQSVEELSEDIRHYLEGLPVSAPPHFTPAGRAEVFQDEPTTGGRSIAVLPFKVLRVEEKTDEFLGMGLTDAIITKLTNIHRILVRPTSSVLKYYDGEQSAQIAGYELNVAFVLDGRIQRAGRRVRVTVQLVRVEDGTPFWAAKFDEDFTDIFAVEDSISSQVAEALIPRLTGQEREALNKRETENASAYQAYLKGRYHWSKFTDDSLGLALECFSEAIRLDPNYALAHVGIAEFYIWAGIYHRLAPKDCYPQAKEAAMRALRIDETLAEAHAALGFATHCYDWDWRRAEEMFKRAINLNSNYAGAHQWYSYLLTSEGRFDEGQKEIRRAVEINPLSVMDLTMVCWNLYQAGEHEQAISESKNVFEVDRNFPVSYIALSAAYERKGMLEEAIAAGRKADSLLPGAVIHLWVLGHALAVSGRSAEAREILAEMHRLSKEDHYISAYHSAIIHVGLGERDEAFACLEKACEERDAWMMWLGTEPKLAELHSDPRFIDLLRRVGLGSMERKELSEDAQTNGRKPKVEIEGISSGQKVLGHEAMVTAASAQAIEHSASQTAEGRTIHVTHADLEAVKRSRRNWVLALASVIVIAVVGYTLFRLLSQGRQSPHFQSSNMVKLTTSGNVTSAAISPDGKYAAYAIDEAGKQGLWVRQIAIGNNIRIVAPAEVDYRGLTFSPDGSYVYYVSYERSGTGRGRLYQVPALGGPAREVKQDVDSPVSFSANGKQFAFVREIPDQGEEALVVANEDGSLEQQLASRKFPEHLSTNSAPIWSPDGKRIAYAMQGADAGGFYMKVVEVQLADHTEKIISPQRWLEVGQMAWLSDGSGLIITAQSEDSSFVQVWHLSYPGGEARRITNDLSDYRGLSLPADSRALLTVQRQTFTSIWVMLKGAGQPAQITSGAGRYFDLSWTPDSKILYASDASGNADIWEIEADGTNQKQLTAGAGRNYGPVASPDGRYILFHSNRSGAWQIWRMNADGSHPLPLTNGKEESNWAQVSPDGRWVIYQHVGALALATLWRVSIDGGAPERLTDDLAMRPSISQDGKLIAYWQKEQTPNAPWRIAIVPFEGGAPIKLLDVPQSAANGNSVLHWSQDASAVIYIDLRDGVTNLLSQPLTGGPPKPLTNFNKDQFYAFDLARDGQLILARGLRTNDAVLINDAK
ncbi:MAG: eukaryotic-like serine/threonine-protein kinase [Acidobacteriota bacterium]|jgi:serine/threonine protein kinase/Tol biopolymer transport system component/tetratricopeptide (TPR) repeat protein|nr:eukaryotic-like serine/threonine-protein kinase [Acidobacteriota bacterium]